MSKGGVHIELDKKDYKDLISKIENLDAYNNIVDTRLKVAAQAAANEAGRNAPVNDGIIKKGIFSEKIKKLIYKVVSNAPYSPFVEWGTRHKFSSSNLSDMRALGIPDSYAAQFKATPLKKATNLSARPFFFPAIRNNWEKALKQIEKDIRKIIKKKKLNNITIAFFV